MLVRPRRALAAVGAVLIAALLVASPALGATDPEPAPGATPAPGDLVSFGISPAGVERPDDRPYLSMEAPAGAVVYEHAALVNQDDQPITLDVYGTDVVMADGGITARARGDASTDAGSWVTVTGPTTVEVPAQTVDTGYGYAIVPFTVTIPANAEPGDHIAGLVASLVSQGQGGENAPSISFEQRVVARVYIRVAGALDPRLEISDVTATWAPGSAFSTGQMSVSYTLSNTGNVRMAVQPRVAVAGPFDLLSRAASGDRVDELMPGGAVHQTTTVRGVWPLVRETVTVSATVLAATNGTDPGIGTVSTSVHVWAVPWVILGVLLALLIALVVLEQRRRRRVARRKVRAAERAARRGVQAEPQSVEPSTSNQDAVSIGSERR